jgi:hypothetical protein
VIYLLAIQGLRLLRGHGSGDEVRGTAIGKAEEYGLHLGKRGRESCFIWMAAWMAAEFEAEFEKGFLHMLLRGSLSCHACGMIF